MVLCKFIKPTAYVQFIFTVLSSGSLRVHIFPVQME